MHKFLTDPVLRDWSRGLFDISRYTAFENMTHRTQVMAHAQRVAGYSRNMYLMLTKFGRINLDCGKLIFMAANHDNAEILQGDIPASVKRSASPEEKREMKEEERKALDEVRNLSFRQGQYTDYLEVYEEYEKRESIEARLVNFADKNDGLHEAVHEVVCGDYPENFKGVIAEYREEFRKLREQNRDWQDIVEQIFGPIFDFPCSGFSPKNPEELDYSSFTAFLKSLTNGNPSSYGLWLAVNKEVYDIHFLHNVFPGWISRFPSEILAEVERVEFSDTRASQPFVVSLQKREMEWFYYSLIPELRRL